MSRGPIVFVTEGGPHIWAIANSLVDRFGPITVIQETPYSKRDLLMRRARKLGWVNVAGQLGTMVLVRLGKSLFGGSIRHIVEAEGLQPEPRPGQKIIDVASPTARKFLKSSTG